MPRPRLAQALRMIILCVLTQVVVTDISAAHLISSRQAAPRNYRFRVLDTFIAIYGGFAITCL
jgi:hypothetical protein